MTVPAPFECNHHIVSIPLNKAQGRADSVRLYDTGFLFQQAGHSPGWGLEQAGPPGTGQGIRVHGKDMKPIGNPITMGRSISRVKKENSFLGPCRPVPIPWPDTQPCLPTAAARMKSRSSMESTVLDSGRARVMASIRLVSKIVFRSQGTAALTKPHPARSAAWQQRMAAPFYPRNQPGPTPVHFFPCGRQQLAGAGEQMSLEPSWAP